MFRHPAAQPFALVVGIVLASLIAACTPRSTPHDTPTATPSAPPPAAVKPPVETTALPPSPPPPVGQPPYRGHTTAPAKISVTGVPPPSPAAPPVITVERSAMAQPAAAYIAPRQDRERYAHYVDNPVHLAAEQSVSTFGLDVDTASYANVRRMLQSGQLPPPDAVRSEEFINAFDYGYAPPRDRTQPFSVTTELGRAPWNPEHRLLLIGVQGYRVPTADRPPANLVFLIDTSGSMNSADKLPLLQASLRQLVPQLDAGDHVAIVTYAGSAGVALASTRGDDHARILGAIDALVASGSTNGEAGLKLAYAQATQGFIRGGTNRVLLATDGDFNVGVTDTRALTGEIARRRKTGIALTVLSFGAGNYNDELATALADAGDGNHAYIDNLTEARRVLSTEASATLMTIAKDVKVQVEFNAEHVAAWRLIGYTKRLLDRADFNNDQVDAGEIGAGANVTALYEITPVGSARPVVDPLRYGDGTVKSPRHGNELAFVRVRYKPADATTSRLIERTVAADDNSQSASARLNFAASVAAFAEYLRGGKYLAGYTLRDVAQLARSARGGDPHGQRAGFIQLVELAASLEPPPSARAPSEPVPGLR